MSLSAATVWEVRTTGSDNSGGGFVAGASGTDRSQQDAAHASGTNLTVDGSTNTDVAPDGYTPVAADVGNLIQITTTGGGAAFTTGFYEIRSIQSGKWRLDRSPAATSSSGATWALGGALATINKLASGFVASNKAFVKAGSGYTTAGEISFGQSATPQSTVTPNHLIGYTAARGDGGRATLTLTGGTNLTVLNCSGSGWRVENIAVDCQSRSSTSGIATGTRSVVHNCKVLNSGGNALTVGGAFGGCFYCEVSGAGGSGIVTANSTWVVGNYVHGGTGHGISVQYDCLVESNLVANQSGSSDGINFGDATSVVARHNTVYNCGRDGIRIGNIRSSALVRNNVLVSNGGYGLNCTETGMDAWVLTDGNAYFGNTSGARSGVDDTSGVFGVNPYVNTLDVTLTGNPFTNAAGGDFSLNNTAGAGAACRGAGTPGALPGVSQAGYPDLGVFQHQEVTDYPDEEDVRNGVSYGSSAHTGTLTLPAAGSVLLGVTYGAGGTEFTGTLDPATDYPAADDVRFGTLYSHGTLTGTLTLPDEADVRQGTLYGGAGVEFAGTLVVPGSGGGGSNACDQVANALVVAVQSLGWTLPNSGDPVPVTRRKSPTHPAGVPLPEVVVVVGEEGDSEYLTATRDLIKYPCAVIYFTPGGHRLADEPELRDRRLAIRRVAELPATFSNVAGFNMVRAGGKVPYDPASITKDLNHSVQLFTVEVIEDRDGL